MAYTVDTKPLKENTIVGQDMIYTVSSPNATDATKYKYKYIVYPLYGYIGSISFTTVIMDISANAAGVGIADVSSVYEQYLSADYLGNMAYFTVSTFKGTAFSLATPHPIHCIDKFALSNNAMINFGIFFYESYATTPNGATAYYYGASSYLGRLLNGMDYGGEQNMVANNYGVDYLNWNNKKYIYDGGSTLNTNINFLTNSPDTLYIGDNDYHTMAFFAGYWEGYAIPAGKMQVVFRDASGAQIGSSTNTTVNNTNGGWDGTNSLGFQQIGKELQYVGVGPANFAGAGISVPANWDTYTVTLTNTSGYGYHEVKTFKKQNPDCKGFENIRLTWLNKFGVWDYYNFTKKNSRSTNIKRSDYTQIKGNWNGAKYNQYGYQGGKTGLTTSPTRVINCNSDWFTTDEEAAWLEELFISNEVFILNGKNNSDAGTNGAEYGKYVTPVTVTSKKYEKYTEANDKVAQYEIEVTYAENIRTQKG